MHLLQVGYLSEVFTSEKILNDFWDPRDFFKKGDLWKIIRQKLFLVSLKCHSYVSYGTPTVPQSGINR